MSFARGVSDPQHLISPISRDLVMYAKVTQSLESANNVSQAPLPSLGTWRHFSQTILVGPGDVEMLFVGVEARMLQDVENVANECHGVHPNRGVGKIQSQSLIRTLPAANTEITSWLFHSFSHAVTSSGFVDAPENAGWIVQEWDELVVRSIKCHLVRRTNLYLFPANIGTKQKFLFKLRRKLLLATQRGYTTESN